MVPSDSRGDVPRVVNFKSTYLDFPILEYRTYRSFGANNSSTLLFELFAGVDRPYHVPVSTPTGAPQVNLRTVYSVVMRIVFDWRYYF